MTLTIRVTFLVHLVHFMATNSANANINKVCMTHMPAEFKQSEDRCKDQFYGTCRQSCRNEETMVEDISCLPFESACVCCRPNIPVTGKQDPPTTDLNLPESGQEDQVQAVPRDTVTTSIADSSTIRVCKTHNPIIFQRTEDRCKIQFHGMCRRTCQNEETIVKDISCLPFESACVCCATNAPRKDDQEPSITDSIFLGIRQQDLVQSVPITTVANSSTIQDNQEPSTTDSTLVDIQQQDLAQMVPIKTLSTSSAYSTTSRVCKSHNSVMFQTTEDRCKSQFHGMCRRSCRHEETMVEDISCLPFESACVCCRPNIPTTDVVNGDSTLPRTSMEDHKQLVSVPTMPTKTFDSITIQVCMTHNPVLFGKSEDRCRTQFHGTCRRTCQGRETILKDISCLPFETACVCCRTNTSQIGELSNRYLPGAPQQEHNSLVSTTTTQESCLEKEQCSCRKEFFRVDGQCIMFNFNSYSWEAAARSCEKYNASLGQIENFEKLAQPMKDLEISELDYWLGITKSSNSDFTWFNNKGKVLGPWATEEPDTRFNCVIMCWKDTDSPKLCSQSCAETRPFICTYEPNSGSYQFGFSLGAMLISLVLQLGFIS